jgi:hypothetical protein
MLQFKVEAGPPSQHIPVVPIVGGLEFLVCSATLPNLRPSVNGARSFVAWILGGRHFELVCATSLAKYLALYGGTLFFPSTAVTWSVGVEECVRDWTVRRQIGKERE